MLSIIGRYGDSRPRLMSSMCDSLWYYCFFRMTIHQSDIKDKARKLFTQLGYDGTFSASHGWISNKFLKK